MEADWAGETAVICVDELTVKLAAGVEAKLTALAPRKPVPVKMTVLLPATGPASGLTAVTDGAAS